MSTAVTTKGLPAPKLTTFALIGGGWRSTVFLHLAYLFPERYRVTGVVARREEAGDTIERNWGVRTFRSLDDLLAAERPHFVVPVVPRPVAPDFVRELVERGLPVLAETPPAANLDEMRSLWTDVAASSLVQVAEQYPLMPLHAARIALVEEGAIGVPTSVSVSSTHLYHAVALMRRFLGAGIRPATVLSQTFRAPLVDPIGRPGWTHDESLHDRRSILSTVDFGDSQHGVYDFTDTQWFNPARPDHLRVRGTTGELDDETLVRMTDAVTPVTSRIERTMSGLGMNYEGFDLQHLAVDGRVVYRNPVEGGRLNDDELGVAALLDRMSAWVRGDGAPPYPLAEAMHDHQIGLAIEESAVSGAPVTTSIEDWTP